MKLRNIFIALVLLFGAKAMAQAPLAGCWHPDFVKDWTPEKDPDRKFNRATIPLQQRIATDETLKAHSQQFPEGQVAACLTMHPMASQVPSQGAYNFTGYNPTYWQYLDLLVWWGGSAGEGIILPPSAPVIDAAHMNGTKVLGQVFFPPMAFSGLPAWTHEMNSTTGNGVYPYARKLAEIAKYYGFDGWFLNSETITSTSWTNWTKDYLRYAQEIGLEGQEIQLYDMSTSCTSERATGVAHQIGGSFMANYGGTNNAINAANSHGDESVRGNKFESWYAGQEQSGSITANGSNVKRLFTTTGHAASVNFFNPEEPTWKQVVKNILETPNNNGSQAYSAMKTVFDNEKRFWTNTTGDVTSQARGTSNTMPGLATMIQERSAIQSKPFISTFSLGLGKHWFVNGEKKGTQDWYHRGMQTIMPTWRWWVTKNNSSTSDIKFDHNWDDAYNIGTSVDMSGNLTNNTDYTINLYKTKIAVEAGDLVQLVYKTNVEGSITVKLGTDATSANTTAFEPASSTTQNGWTVDTYDISSLSGSDLRLISLNINAGTAGSGYKAQLGQISVSTQTMLAAVFQKEVSNLEIQNDLAPTTGDLRIIWDHPADISDVHHYNVYLTRKGVTTLAGQTRNEGYYIPKFDRDGLGETSLSVTVKAVNKNMEESAEGQTVAAEFPPIDLPEVSVTASKSLLNPNEEVTFTATATNFPDNYEWIAPETGKGELVSSNGNKATYKFATEGKHSVELKVSNSEGTTNYTAKYIVNVQTASLTIVSRKDNGGSVSGTNNGYDVSSFMVASGEHPGWLIDNSTVPGGISQKWCAGGEKEHWTIITLDKIYELYRFVIYDCGHKENAADNLTHYKIFTSVDKQNWEEVLDMQNVPATAAYNTKDHYIAPTFAKYIKFVPYDPDKAITIRIWQFDAYGMEGTPTPNLTSLKSDKRVAKVNEEVSFSVDATQNPESFVWEVQGGTKISQEDTSTGSTAKFTFSQEGIYNVTVTAINAGGDKSLESKKLIQVSDTEQLISLNKTVILTNGDEASANYLTDGITEPTNIAHRWAGNGDADYWAIIDLEDSYDITRFVTFDVRTMDPASQSNINHYNIFVANEIDEQGEADWVQAVRGRNASNKNVKDDYMTETITGRYVKFNPYDWSLFQPRVYEFEVYGKRTSTGVENIFDSKELKIYPNPVSQGQSVNIRTGNNDQLTIFTIDGKIAYQQKVTESFTQVSTAQLNRGVYIVQTSGKDGKATAKLVVN